MRCLILFCFTGYLAACAAPRAEVAHPPHPVEVTSTRAPPVVRADVQFMRGMVAHHAQAVEMAAMVPTRTNSASLKLLAERIDVSQKDEIRRMTRWLQAVGDLAHAHEHMARTGAEGAMPGMLGAEDFAKLRAARGTDFDRHFLQFMIRHHEGALTMVARLFANPASVQDPELYQLANNIDADQRAEIARMGAMLSNLQ